MRSTSLLSVVFCVILFITAIYAQNAAQCGTPPTLIPDTFTISYQPVDATHGVVYFTYSEPGWENWPMFDIRELASDPFTAAFTIPVLDTYLTFELVDCDFKTPQSYTRPTPVTSAWDTSPDAAPKTLLLTFSQSGTFYCQARPVDDKINVRGRQQYSVTGQLNLRKYHCDGTEGNKQPTATHEIQTVDGASKVSLPDLFVHQRCSRLTFTYESLSQLTLRQTNGLALDISNLPEMVLDEGATSSRTVLMSYTINRVVGKKQGANDVYSNVLSFCTFNGQLPSNFNVTQLFVPGTISSSIQSNIKGSKVPSYCLNGIKDFDESDVDCGGNGQLNGCPPCVDASQICNGNSDCASGQCIPHEIAGKRCFAISGANGFTGIMIVVIVGVLGMVLF